MPVDAVYPWLLTRVLFVAHAATGATRIRHSLRPLGFRGWFVSTTRASLAAGRRAYVWAPSLRETLSTSSRASERDPGSITTGLYFAKVVYHTELIERFRGMGPRVREDDGWRTCRVAFRAVTPRRPAPPAPAAARAWLASGSLSWSRRSVRGCRPRTR